MNEKWYFLCDLNDKVAVELTQIPAVYGNITGLSDLNDEALARLDWAGRPNLGFLQEAEAVSLGVTNLEAIKLVGEQVALVTLREKRDALLRETDKLVLADTFAAFSEKKRAAIVAYRQELKAITEAPDLFNVAMPTRPASISTAAGLFTDRASQEYQEARQASVKESQKIHRAMNVASLTVEVRGKVFDGDEDSQNRMNRAITIMAHTNVSSIAWKLATNEVAQVTIEDLKDALTAAGALQLSLWF